MSPATNFKQTNEALLMIETFAALILFKKIKKLRKIKVLRFFLNNM